MRAIQITAFGGPDVLTPVELDDPAPGAGQVLVDVRAQRSTGTLVLDPSA